MFPSRIVTTGRRRATTRGVHVPPRTSSCILLGHFSSSRNSAVRRSIPAIISRSNSEYNVDHSYTR